MVHAAICPNNPVQLLWAWEKSVDHLKKAIEITRGRYSPEDIFNLLVANGSLYQLWIVIDGTNIVASCVTQIIQYPRKKYLHVFLLGGVMMHKWESILLGEIHSFASSIGCNGVELLGRKGWSRILEKYGYISEQMVGMDIDWSNS